MNNGRERQRQAPAAQTTETAGGISLGDIAEETKLRSVYDRVAKPFDAIERMGLWLFKSGMLGLKSPEQGYVVALTCFEERITPLEFARRYHIIEGKPSKRADRMAADFQARGGTITWVETSADAAEAAFAHPKHAPRGLTIRVTFAEMKERRICIGKGNVVKDNWSRHPDDMLAARCVSKGIRRVDPGCVAGEYTPEEVADFEGNEHVELIPTGTAPQPAQEPPKKTKPRGKTKPKDKPAEPASEPQDAPPDPEEDAATEHAERVAKVVEAFKGMAIVQADLEARAGNYETGEIVVADDWTGDHFMAFEKAFNRIRKLSGEERQKALSAEFQIPMSVLKG